MQYEGHKIRHELKYYINQRVYLDVKTRLQLVLQKDPNMVKSEGYLVSSLYFDDMYHSALHQKQSGVRFRKKFRIRSYELDPSFIRLECKSKYDAYIAKESAVLTKEEYDCILNDSYEFLGYRPEKVCKELLAYNRSKRLRPKVVVEYLREAYISPIGNVRITFDKDISTSIGTIDMFDEDYRTMKVLEEGEMVMEVKYDDFIPSHILAILQTAMTEKCAISKYVMCIEKNKEMKMV
ncbi:MAG: polyphosphate polymerase domain-containing protein [Niameybacter sp.]|nr:polyphosphate polymerase domain-containing protein [Niameybacter sp.]